LNTGTHVIAGKALQRGQLAVIKGRALEDLVVYLFSKVPGLILTARNSTNAFDSEELEIAFWNERKRNGLHFLPDVVLVECKNWSTPVGVTDVGHFDGKIRRRGLEYGILVAVNGVTGDQTALTAAQHIIYSSLQEGRKILVITRQEIESLQNTNDLILLLKQKITALYVEGAIF
jgi:hypothetical protein